MDIDTLTRLKPKSEKVLVDETELTLRTLLVVQHAALAKALRAIDPKHLLDAAAPIMEAASVNGHDFVRSLVEHGAALWAAALDTIGSEAADALRDVAAQTLDTRVNYDALVAAKHLPTGDAETESGVYVGSEALRAWINRSITLEQAVYIVSRAITLSNYAAIGKTLFLPLMRRMAPTIPAAPTNGSETTQTLAG